MEQEEYYKRLLAILGDIEKKGNDGGYYEDMKSLVKNNVELEFEKCMTALVARKQVLLQDIELKFQDEVRKMATQEDSINTAIKAKRQVLQAGASIYSVAKESAVKMWKVAAELDAGFHLVVEFPDPSLAHAIASYGTVTAPIPYSRADTVSTLAGSIRGNEEGSGVDAKFSHPLFASFNPIDNCVYLSDLGSNSIRKVTEQGAVSTFAKISPGQQFNRPFGVASYHKDNCFFVCSNGDHTIKKITASGVISDFAGNGQAGNAEGIGASASFHFPRGITVDKSNGNLYVTDNATNMIRKITPQGEVSNLAGTGKPGSDDGAGKSATFNAPNGICFDERDNSLVICDTENNKLRKIELKSGEVKTICEIAKPIGISITRKRAFIVTVFEHKVMIVIQRGSKYEVKQLVGSGVEGYEDGDALGAKFNSPWGIAVDSTTCYVVDCSNHRIRKFSLV